MKKLVLLATIFIFSNITSANGSNAMQQDQINDIEKSNPIDEYFFTENSADTPQADENRPKEKSSALIFAQGCAAGLAVGTFIVPAVGSLTGCIVAGSARFFYKKSKNENVN